MSNIIEAKGEPLSESDLELERQIVESGRMVVELVQEGKIKLERSVLAGNVLFVCTDEGYFVLSDKEHKVQFSDTPDFESPHDLYGGDMADLESLLETLKSWIEEAKS